MEGRIPDKTGEGDRSGGRCLFQTAEEKDEQGVYLTVRKSEFDHTDTVKCDGDFFLYSSF